MQAHQNARDSQTKILILRIHKYLLESLVHNMSSYYLRRIRFSANLVHMACAYIHVSFLWAFRKLSFQSSKKKTHINLHFHCNSHY